MTATLTFTKSKNRANRFFVYRDGQIIGMVERTEYWTTRRTSVRWSAFNVSGSRRAGGFMSRKEAAEALTV